VAVQALVIGGGITGLAAAHALAQARIPVTLVEASERLGGKIRTERIDGFLVESGPDSFVSYRPAAVQLARSLGLGDALVGPREPRVVQIRTGGRFFPLPQEMGLVLPTRLRPFVTTPLFSPLQKARMGLDLLLPRDGLAHDVGVGVYLRRRLGPALVDRLAGPLLGGVYGTSIDELSLLAVVPQLRDAEREHRSLFLASLAAGRARPHGQGRGSPFVTLAGGTGQLVAGLVAALEQMPGVTIRTRTPVAALERDGSGVTVRLAGGEVLRSDATILTVPGPEAIRLLAQVAPASAAALGGIPHGTTAVVSLGYRQEQFGRPPEGHGFLVAAGEPLSIDAVTISSNKWPDRAPGGAVLVRAFIGSRSGRASGMRDADVVAAAARDVATTLGARGDPLLAHLARLPDQMPQYTVGHLDRVAAVMDGLRELPGLLLAGAPYRGVGIPDCIAQGQAAARAAGELLASAPA
jgi:oxygen-dependent protoporphyrinogen oxidase